MGCLLQDWAPLDLRVGVNTENCTSLVFCKHTLLFEDSLTGQTLILTPRGLASWEGITVMAESHTLSLGSEPPCRDGSSLPCLGVENRSTQRVSFPGYLPHRGCRGPFWEMLSNHLILPSCQPARDSECTTGPQLITFRCG